MIGKKRLIICTLPVVVILFIGNNAFAVPEVTTTSITIQGENLTVQPGSTFDYDIFISLITPATDLTTGGDFDVFFFHKI